MFQLRYEGFQNTVKKLKKMQIILFTMSCKISLIKQIE
jgi:hypothetical protein